jgi:hypothetical protein
VIGWSFGILAVRMREAWTWRPGIFRALTPKRVRELAGRLEAEKEALHSFSACMEDEFLELGALLRKIVSVARQLRNRSDEVIAAASGRTEDAAIQFAFQLLKKAEDLVQAGREQHKNVFAVFEKMHLDLTQVARERNELVRVLKPLETTNVHFRIQACAFDESTRSQFFALAEAIAGIVKEIQVTVGQRFEELERAGQATGQLVTTLATTAAGQKRETEAMLAESRNHLSLLSEVLLSSETEAQGISQAGANIAAGVSKAIVALQCQDMARQKFEHISAAMDEITLYLEGEIAGGLTSAQGADCQRFLADGGRVQLAQLRSVFDQLDEAARQVKGGLEEVDSQARTFADYAIRSGGATLDGKIIGRAVQSIHAVLTVIDDTVTNVHSVAQLVVQLKSTFSDCTSQILGLALKLRIVALNAQIFAAHVDAGTALEVVARNTRVIVEEAMQQLDDISLRVTQLVDLLIDLEQRLGDHGELASGERDLLALEAGESERKLCALEQELRTAVAAIVPLEVDLSSAVRQTTERIRFPDAVAEASARSTAFFKEIVLQYSDATPRAGGAFHHKVQALKSKYTMAHERDVHELALGGDGGSRSGLPGEAAVREFPEHAATEQESLQFVAAVRLETHTDSLVGASVASTMPAPMEADDDKLADNVELF